MRKFTVILFIFVFAISQNVFAKPPLTARSCEIGKQCCTWGKKKVVSCEPTERCVSHNSKYGSQRGCRSCGIAKRKFFGVDTYIPIEGNLVRGTCCTKKNPYYRYLRINKGKRLKGKCCRNYNDIACENAQGNTTCCEKDLCVPGVGCNTCNENETLCLKKNKEQTCCSAEQVCLSGKGCKKRKQCNIDAGETHCINKKNKQVCCSSDKRCEMGKGCVKKKEGCVGFSTDNGISTYYNISCPAGVACTDEQDCLCGEGKVPSPYLTQPYDVVCTNCTVLPCKECPTALKYFQCCPENSPVSCTPRGSKDPLCCPTDQCTLEEGCCAENEQVVMGSFRNSEGMHNVYKCCPKSDDDSPMTVCPSGDNNYVCCKSKNCISDGTGLRCVQ